MRTSRWVTWTVVIALVGGQLTACGDEQSIDQACTDALELAVEVENTRSEALSTLIDATDVDPNDLAGVVARSEDVLQVVNGSVMRLTERADRQAARFNRLAQRCEQAQDGVLPRPCVRAFDQASELAQAYTDAINTRLAWWTAELERARATLAGDVTAANAAVDEIDRLIVEYNELFDRIEQLGRQRNRAYEACNAAL